MSGFVTAKYFSVDWKGTPERDAHPTSIKTVQPIKVTITKVRAIPRQTKASLADSARERLCATSRSSDISRPAMV